MRLAVCMPQVPFERGGTEIFADGLVHALRERGHETELVTVPYKWYPGEQVLTQAFLWRLLDLEEANGRPIDAVIATKFPSYAVRHPRKVVWLLHQFRQAWDLDRTELGQFSESAEDRALRRKVLELDRVALGEARKIFTTSSIVAGRLRDSTGLDAEVLAPPPAPLDFHCTGVRGLHPLGQPARPREADRPADRGGRAGVRPAHRDRRRRPRPRAPRAARARPRARRPRDLHGPRQRRRSWPISTRAASASTTRRSTRTTASSRTRRSSPRSRS